MLGYAAVWATENTREAIFDAIARETYIPPAHDRRFFGGWDFRPGRKKRLPANAGYAKASHGRRSPRLPCRQIPTFLVAALRIHRHNLDRIQSSKAGWTTKRTAREVRRALVRPPQARPKTGKLSAVGNTVDVAELIGVDKFNWRPGELMRSGRPRRSTRVAAEAFYRYARVIEIPTPRWTYDIRGLVKMDKAAAA